MLKWEEWSLFWMLASLLDWRHTLFQWRHSLSDKHAMIPLVMAIDIVCKIADIPIRSISKSRNLRVGSYERNIQAEGVASTFFWHWYAYCTDYLITMYQWYCKSFALSFICFPSKDNILVHQSWVRMKNIRTRPVWRPARKVNDHLDDIACNHILVILNKTSSH